MEAEFEATQNTETPLEFLLKSMRDTAAEPADCSSRQGGGAIMIQSCRHWLTDFVTGTATIGRFRISSASLRTGVARIRSLPSAITPFLRYLPPPGADDGVGARVVAVCASMLTCEQSRINRYRGVRCCRELDVKPFASALADSAALSWRGRSR